MTEFSIIYRCFPQDSETNSQGIFYVNLHDRGQPKRMCISNLIPCIYSEPIYGGHELWQMILFKAFAVHLGTWHGLERITHGEALSLLTGTPVHEQAFHWERLVELFNHQDGDDEDSDLISYVTTIGVSDPHDEETMEIFNMHGIDPTECQQMVLQGYNDDVEDSPLIKLYHPRTINAEWMWNGDYGKDSDFWTDELKEKCDYEGTYEECGTGISFWMPFH
jgi:hypothetical protein